MYSQTFEDLLYKMKSTQQFTNVNVHEHGLMVVDSYNNLINELDRGIDNDTLLSVYEKTKHKLLDDT